MQERIQLGSRSVRWPGNLFALAEVAATPLLPWTLFPLQGSTTATSSLYLGDMDFSLQTGKGRQAAELVNTYATNESLFFQQFAKSMVKMGNINPLTGSKGQVQKDCRHLN
ncbi:hypothetical protein ACFX13_043267 [Malus domestica]